MTRTKRLLAMLAFTIYIAAAVSCSCTGNLALDGQGGFLLEADTVSDSIFCDLLEDMSSWTANSNAEDSPLDRSMDEFLATMLQANSVKGVTAKKIDEAKYHITLDVSNWMEMLLTWCTPQEAMKLVNVIPNEDGTRTVNIRLDLESYATLKKLVPVLGDPYLAVYGPEYNSIYTDEEYLDMMEFLFDSNCDIRSAITESVISLAVKGAGENKGDAVFDIPLIRLLTLNKPVEISFTY